MSTSKKDTLITDSKEANSNLFSGEFFKGVASAFKTPDDDVMAEAGKSFASAATGAIGGAANSLISGGLSSTGGAAIDTLGNIVSAVPGPIGMIGGPVLKGLGGLTNRAFGSKENKENVAQVNNNITTANSFKSDANSFDSMSDVINSTASVANFNKSYIGKDGWFSNKIAKKYKDLQNQRAEANAFIQNSLNNNISNLQIDQTGNVLANYASMGGLLSTNGMDVPLQLIQINEGGSHEENPNNGVQVGVDKEGIPNLVEEGETIFNNYVFSRRLKVPKAFREKYKLGNEEISFADASKKFSKEADETPNDPITKRGLIDSMAKLREAQEEVREKQAKRKGITGIQPNQMEQAFANGGNLFDGEITRVGNGTALIYHNNYGYNMNAENAFKYSYFPNWDFNNAGTTGISTMGGDIVDGNELLMSEQDWNKLYSNEEFIRRRNFYHDNWDKGWFKPYKKQYIDRINKYSKNKKSEVGRELPGLSYDMSVEEFDKITSDKKLGRGHFLDYIEDPTINITKGNKKRIVTNMRGLPNGDVIPASFKDQLTMGLVNDPNYIGMSTYTEEPLISNENLNTKNKNIDGKGNNKENPKKNNTDDFEPAPVWMRYAPVFGSAFGAMQSALTPADYSNAEAMIQAGQTAGNYTSVSFSPIGDYMTYRPLDRQYAINQLNANAGANRRNILNTSGMNRGQAMAGLLASDYNAGNNIGNLFRQAEEYNLAQREKVATFNRATNQYNSEGFLKADMANQSAAAQAKQMGLSALMQGYNMREQIAQNRANAIAANLSGIFQGLGDIGFDNMNYNMANDVSRKTSGYKYKNRKGVTEYSKG